MLCSKVRPGSPSARAMLCKLGGAKLILASASVTMCRVVSSARDAANRRKERDRGVQILGARSRLASASALETYHPRPRRLTCRPRSRTPWLLSSRSLRPSSRAMPSSTVSSRTSPSPTTSDSGTCDACLKSPSGQLTVVSVLDLKGCLLLLPDVSIHPFYRPDGILTLCATGISPSSARRRFSPSTTLSPSSRRSTAPSSVRAPRLHARTQSDGPSPQVPPPTLTTLTLLGRPSPASRAVSVPTSSSPSSPTRACRSRATTVS